MSLPTTTSTQLLRDLADPRAQEVWRLFDDRYRPIVAGFARRRGLQHDVAADVAQETLMRFVQAYREGKYERGRGRLRSWLIGIARNLIWSAQRPRGPRQVALDVDVLEVAEAPDERAIWGLERSALILRRALQELRDTSRTSEKSLAAFELVVLEQVAPEAAAERLGMTRHDVYVAKHRVADRLREIVQRLEAIFDDDVGT